MITIDKLRKTILEVINSEVERNTRSTVKSHLLTSTICSQVASKLNFNNNQAYEQMTLSAFQSLINAGYLAWGLNFMNPNPPCFHVTDQGIKSLENLSRDPSNPIEYMRYIDKLCQLNDIERSYFNEAISTFNSGHHKSAAVMIGATAECLILKLRDAIKAKHTNPPKTLSDWKAKNIFNALKSVLDKHTNLMPNDLHDEYNAYWPALNEQLRRTRNDAGHPENISSFTFEDVYASLLMFPNIAKLTNHLMNFIHQNTFT